MTIDSIGVDFDDVNSTSRWAQSEAPLNPLDEKISEMLFRNGQTIGTHLAFIGFRPEKSFFARKEITNPLCK